MTVPISDKRGELQSMVRRYFEERFPKSEQIELFFNGRKCYLKVVRILPTVTPDGRPSSKYEEHRERYEIYLGAGSHVMEVPA